MIYKTSISMTHLESFFHFEIIGVKVSLKLEQNNGIDLDV